LFGLVVILLVGFVVLAVFVLVIVVFVVVVVVVVVVGVFDDGCDGFCDGLTEAWKVVCAGVFLLWFAVSTLGRCVKCFSLQWEGFLVLRGFQDLLCFFSLLLWSVF